MTKRKFYNWLLLFVIYNCGMIVGGLKPGLLVFAVLIVVSLVTVVAWKRMK